jgi:putative membrane protein
VGDSDREPDVRFSLANERTFLAWARTCMAMVATGLVLARLLGDVDEDPLTVASGVVLIILGAVLALLSYRNYRRNDEAIRARAPLVRSSLPLVLIATIAVASIVAIALSLAG